MSDQKIRSITPAVPGWKVAYLHDDGEIELLDVALWALIGEDDEHPQIHPVAFPLYATVPAVLGWDFIAPMDREEYLGILSPNAPPAHIENIRRLIPEELARRKRVADATKKPAARAKG